MVRTIIVLTVTQIIAWGTIGFPTVLAPHIAADLNLSLPTVFAGPSVMSIVTALVSPAFGQRFVRHGARRMLTFGALTAAPGLVLITFAQGAIAYFGGWILIGIAGASMLTIGAHIFLNELAGAGAKGPISALMVMTGLSSAVFLPVTATLDAALGWRGTCLVFAGLLGCINAALCYFGLPRQAQETPAQPASQNHARRAAPRMERTTFLLIAGALALSAFTTFGISAVMVQLFRSLGYSEGTAVAFGSVISLVQVTARGLDILAAAITGKSWDGLTSGTIAAITAPLALLTLALGAGHIASVVAFIGLYGFSSGVLAVARSTIPLVFYDRGDYARILSRIGLPLNLTVAISPPLMAALLGDYGPGMMLTLALATTCLSLALLLALGRRRPLQP